jgi:hypothetical protein
MCQGNFNARFSTKKILLTLLFFCAFVNAQNSTTATGIDIHATFNNVGVQVNITGDDNNNAIATMEANINGTGFAPVHNLSKVFLVVPAAGTYPQRFVGSIFSLKPATTVQVRVTVTDPDGVTNAVNTATITTRSKQIPVSSGNNIHVATTGDDTGGTGSAASPFATIQHAIDQSSVGDTVLIHAGIYHEDITISDNQDSPSQAYTTIKAAGDGATILDGTDTSLNTATAWTNEGNNLYSAALNSPNNETYYVGFDGNRMWKYFSLADLQGLIHNTDGGFYSDAPSNRVFVKFPGNSAPAGHQITVSNLHNAITMFNVNNIVFDGLTFKNFNSGEHSSAIHVTDNSNAIWIVNSVFENMETAIRLEAKVVDLVVMGNEFSDQGVQALDWNIVKDFQHWLERGALYCSNDEYSGFGTVFTNNYVHDYFDGVKIVGQEILDFASNSDVVNNRFVLLSDDGVETDGYSSNVRITDNRFETLLIGVSVAPALAGPTYINRNLMVDLKNIANTDFATGAVKFSIGDEIYGDIFIYHNTGTTTEPNREAFSVSNEADWTKLVMKNNIWSGTSYGIYYFLDNANSLDFVEDFDLLFATSNLAAQYQGEDYADIPDYFAASGVCQNCIEGNPLFVNQNAGNYHLQLNSPAIDQATLIPGINALDNNGNLPDMGRFEFVEALIFKHGFE